MWSASRFDPGGGLDRYFRGGNARKKMREMSEIDLSEYTSEAFKAGNKLTGDLTAEIKYRETEVEEEVFAVLPVVVVCADGVMVKEITIYP